MKIEKGQRMLFLIFLLLSCSVAAGAVPLKVVAATADLAAIAEEVGRDVVNVQTICPANQDPHSFEILPQHVIAIREADVYLKVGAGLDYWSDDLLKSSENPLRVVADCSQGIELIRDAEDFGNEHGEHEHALGNPHYWLAPSSLSIIASNIAAALAHADPPHADNYHRNLGIFRLRLDSAMTAWQTTMARCRGERLVTYHRAWDYFARDFGLEIISTVEPQPGAEPTPTNLANLEAVIREKRVQLLLLEPFESDRYARLLHEDTGINVVKATPSVGGMRGTETIFLWMDFLTRTVSEHCATVLQP